MPLSGVKKALVSVLAKVPTNSKLLYPFYLAAQLTLKEDTYASPRLPEAFDGYRVAYASDIHYGPYFDAARVRDLSARLAALSADLLILGGDYGVQTSDAIRFFELLPPLHFPDGMLAVLGNHDLAGRDEEVAHLLSTMEEKGIRPLVNRSHCILRGTDRLCVASVDDIRSGKPDFRAAARGIHPDAYVLFAPHSPDVMPALLVSGAFRPDLTLCGHTHGGQIALFGRSLHSSSRYGNRFLSGWKRIEGLDVLISNGVGTSMLPIRLGAPAQYHLITLRRKETASGNL